MNAIQSNAMYVCRRAPAITRQQLTLTWLKPPRNYGRQLRLYLRTVGRTGASGDDLQASDLQCAGRLLTVTEACAVLRISRYTLYHELIRPNRLRTIKIGSRRLIPKQAVDDLINTLSSGATA